MNVIKKNRRDFLKNALIGAAGVSSFTLFSSCSSFDDYLFEDRHSFDDEVIIIGGGISGLYLAYKLRTNKTEFRLFEGSNTFGGRIKSNEGIDYGASLLSTNHKLAKQLVQELSLETKALDKEFLYLTAGMQSLTDSLVERIIGLIPYRNFRLRWKLVEISKRKSGFELVFTSPSGQKRLNCKKVALAIPPTQWASVSGLLQLPEMSWASEWLKTLEVENTIKIVLPSHAAVSAAKPYLEIRQDSLNFRQILKKNKSTPFLEIDAKFPAKNDVSINYIYGVLKKKLQLNFPFEKLSVDQYYDWRQVKLIGGSKFKNFMAVPDSDSNSFQIVGDFTPSNAIYTVEGALNSVTRASQLLL